MSDISKDIKMCNLVFCSEQMPGLLNRFGIGFGFGEQTVDEVCRRYGVSTRLFLSIADIYIHNSGKLSSYSPDDAEICQLIAFLRKSHEYYHRYFFPKVHSLLHRVLEGRSDDESITINKFFDTFENKIFNHFEVEDKLIFPHIELRLERKNPFARASGTATLPVDHGTLESELSDLRSILVKYLDKVGDEFILIDLLGAVHSIGIDIHCHSIIEEQLILPLAEKTGGYDR